MTKEEIERFILEYKDKDSITDIEFESEEQFIKFFGLDKLTVILPEQN